MIKFEGSKKEMDDTIFYFKDEVARELDPVKYVVFKMNYSELKQFIDDMEAEFKRDEIEKYSLEHFRILYNFFETEANNNYSFALRKEALCYQEKIKWLRVRYLERKIEQDIDKLTDKIMKYLPAHMKSDLLEISNIYAEYHYQMSVELQ